MPTLEISNVPVELYRQIEARARVHGISVEEQAVRDLSLAQRVGPADEAALLEEIRRERDAMAAKGIYLTEEFLQRAKRWGRE